MTVARFLSNARCVIQKQRRHCLPVMLCETKLNARQKKTFVSRKLCFFKSERHKTRHLNWN